jgi:hypothetical protein
MVNLGLEILSFALTFSHGVAFVSPPIVPHYFESFDILKIPSCAYKLVNKFFDFYSLVVFANISLYVYWIGKLNQKNIFNLGNLENIFLV